MEGWERIAVACSFVTSIACPLHWFYAPEDKLQLLEELDMRRVDHYHGLHMHLVHAWLRFIQRARMVRCWRILEQAM